MAYVGWREAWHEALYGPDGFFLTDRPAQHFRTAVTASDVFAEAIARLAREEGLTTVVDLGAGGGELLTRLSRIDAGLTLVGVDLAARPASLPTGIDWYHDLPAEFEGLLVAHEWLDNVPCDVVELDDDGVTRLVKVDPETGDERLGDPIESAWLDAWWPLEDPGARAEIGEPRDEAWAEAVEAVTGLAVAIDYGHLIDARPPYGSLASYREGQEVDIRPDGSRDVTAHVAVDAVCDRVGGCLERQRDALSRLGVDGARPPLEMATSDPPAYVDALARASEAAELRARGGWGDFWWVVRDTRVPD
ncbi:MAG TPA: SAM-dependent methyltransferase [Aeromicrobium sp.]|nr:SAM-dependent methyltransferase [Aeromicrobium sp.]